MDNFDRLCSRIAQMICFKRTMKEIREAIKVEDEAEFFLLYQAAQLFLTYDPDAEYSRSEPPTTIAGEFIAR